MAVKSKTRTITFFELKKIDGVKLKRFKDTDWSSHLGKLAKQPLKDRVHKGTDRTLIGDILDADGAHHLKLMKVRDESAWLEVYDSAADAVSDLDIKDKQDLVETSIVCFLPFGNIIGVVQGSIAAPSASAVAEWVNGLGFLKDVKVSAEVMMSTQALKKLADSPEVTRVEADVHTKKASALTAAGSSLGETLKSIATEYGDMKVTVILRASRSKGKAHKKSRETLRREAATLKSLDDGVSKLKAKLLYYDGDDQAGSEIVDFFKGRVTAKRDIATTAEDGSPIRNSAAVEAILAVAADHETELRGIVEQP